MSNYFRGAWTLFMALRTQIRGIGCAKEGWGGNGF